MEDITLRKTQQFQKSIQPKGWRIFATSIRSVFYPWWKLLIELIGFSGAAIWLYIALLNSVPDIHLATSSSDTPTEFGFYVTENSPFFSLNLRALNCVIVNYSGTQGTKEYVVKDSVIVQPIDFVIGAHQKQIYYRCPLRSYAQVNHLEVVVAAVYDLRFLGVDWKRWGIQSLPFTWPAGPYNRQWREGPAIN